MNTLPPIGHVYNPVKLPVRDNCTNLDVCWYSMNNCCYVADCDDSELFARFDIENNITDPENTMMVDCCIRDEYCINENMTEYAKPAHYNQREESFRNSFYEHSYGDRDNEQDYMWNTF